MSGNSNSNPPPNQTIALDDDDVESVDGGQLAALKAQLAAGNAPSPPRPASPTPGSASTPSRPAGPPPRPSAAPPRPVNPPAFTAENIGTMVVDEDDTPPELAALRAQFASPAPAPAPAPAPSPGPARVIVDDSASLETSTVIADEEDPVVASLRAQFAAAPVALPATPPTPPRPSTSPASSSSSAARGNADLESATVVGDDDDPALAPFQSQPAAATAPAAHNDAELESSTTVGDEPDPSLDSLRAMPPLPPTPASTARSDEPRRETAGPEIGTHRGGRETTPEGGSASPGPGDPATPSETPPAAERPAPSREPLIPQIAPDDGPVAPASRPVRATQDEPAAAAAPAPEPARAPEPAPRDAWQEVAEGTRKGTLASALRGSTAEPVARTPLRVGPDHVPVAVFQSRAFDPAEWSVERMYGAGAMSGLYEYTLEIVALFHEGAERATAQDLLRAPALVGFGEACAYPTHGIVSEVELLTDTPNTPVVYRVTLVPRIWLLTQTVRSRLFHEKSVPDIARLVLRGLGLQEGEHFKLALGRAYVAREYVVQYQESDYQFLCRILEHAGIFFHFEQGDASECMVLRDGFDTIAATVVPEPVPYQPGAGRMDDVEPVVSLACRHRRIPREVALRDYNWRAPSSDLSARAQLPSGDAGAQMLYGDHYKTHAEGRELARVRADEINAEATVYRGRSRVRGLQPGVRFTLEGHFCQDYNQEYVVLEVHHEATQRQGASDSADGSEQAGYSNDFVAIAAADPYSPPRTTPVPRVGGLVHGKISGFDTGVAAPVDEKGRYKVDLPWVAAGSPGESVSRWMRRAQESAGDNYGAHLPVHVGAEVLIAHVEGDPDRPVIVATVSNEERVNPVTETNAAMSVIRTRAGIRIEFTDG